jgi:Ca2+-binding EF-hand superfamily protein
VALTAFRKRKLGMLFDAMDVNRDGHVERADFVRRVETLARLRGWQPGSAPYQRNLEIALDEWQNLRESADVAENGRVAREEFLRYAEVFLTDRDAIRAYARGDVQLMFDAMDADGDGRITKEEYRLYLEACGLDASGADTFFAHADLNEDDHVTRAEMTHAVEEYLVSDDPASSSNVLFGPLD